MTRPVTTALRPSLRPRACRAGRSRSATGRRPRRAARARPKPSTARCRCRRAARSGSRPSPAASRSPAARATRSSIHAVRRATRDRLDDIKLEITQSGNTIEVDANHRLVERRNDNVVETDFDIQVPARTRLDIKTFSAPVTVIGVSASQNIDGFSSDITIESSDFGDGNDIDVNTFSGDVRLRLPASAQGQHRLQQLQRPLRERPAGDAEQQQPPQLPRRAERRRRRRLPAEDLQRRRLDPTLDTGH